MDQPRSATCVAAPVQKEEPKTSERVPDSPLMVIANQLNEGDVLTNASTARKLTLMALFSAAQFLDAFNNWSVYDITQLAIIALTLLIHSALFPAIPEISEKLSFAPSEAAWLISAYQLTFAAFLLLVRSFPHPTP